MTVALFCVANCVEMNNVNTIQYVNEKFKNDKLNFEFQEKCSVGPHVINKKLSYLRDNAGRQSYAVHCHSRSFLVLIERAYATSY